MKKSRIIIFFIILLILVNFAFVFLSYYCFLNNNIYKSIFALVEVKENKDKIIKLSETPDVYMIDESNSVEGFLEEMGFIEIKSKRLGSKYFVLKAGKEYSVLIHATSLYTVFLIEEN